MNEIILEMVVSPRLNSWHEERVIYQLQGPQEVEYIFLQERTCPVKINHLRKQFLPGLVVHSLNPCTLSAEADSSLRV